MSFANFLLRSRFSTAPARLPPLLQLSMKPYPTALSIRSYRNLNLNLMQNIAKSNTVRIPSLRNSMSIQVNLVRNYSLGPRPPASGGPGVGPKFENQRIATKFRQMDGIPPSYDLIYRLNFTSPVVYIQVLNIMGILVATLAVFSLLLNDEDGQRKAPGDSDLLKTFEREKPVINEDAPEFVKRYQANPDLPTPHPNEMNHLSLRELSILYGGLLVLMVALIRLQRTLPIRLYTSPSGHSYAVFYGHIIPSRTTKREFVAGTVKRVLRQSPMLRTDSLYADGTGKQMLLLDYCFRNPSDMNYILGISNTKLYKDDDSDSFGGGDDKKSHK